MQEKKRTASFVLCLNVIAWFLSPIAVAQELTEFERKALAEMEAWIQIVDEGCYEESWNQAGIYFQNMVKQIQWRKSLEFGREPMGKVIKRVIASAKLKTTLPGAPDGQYLVVQFQTQFEHKEKAIETVTSHIDKQGRWRVVGYYIR